MTYIVAEIGLAHDGSLGNAVAMIRAAARAGVDAVKFQCHDADNESSEREPWRAKPGMLDRSRFDYWKRTEFTPAQWAVVGQEALARRVDFIVSPFSIPAAERLLDVAVVDFFKIASGEVSNLPLIEWCAERRPIIVSMGLADGADMANLLSIQHEHAEALDSLTVLACTPEYPTAPRNAPLGMLRFLRRSFNRVGLSDHSGDIVIPIAAIAQGAEVIEVHVAWSKDQFGPDSKASLTFDQLAKLVEASDELDETMNNPFEQLEPRADLKRTFSRSACAGLDLPVGHVIEARDILMLKPGGGLSMKDALDQLVGTVTDRDMKKGDQF